MFFGELSSPDLNFLATDVQGVHQGMLLVRERESVLKELLLSKFRRRRLLGRAAWG